MAVDKTVSAASRSRVAVIGAGAVGTTIVYAMMLKGIAREVVLIDVAAEKAAAEVKDLMHGSLFVPPVEITAGDLEACADADVVVITAGAKQKPGQTRLQLVETNAQMLREMVPRIQRVAPDAILLLVSNPVDVLTYVTWKISGLPPARVIGSGTVLDTSRFRSLLARKLGVAVANVHAYIVGEHGDSEVPLWSSAQIANIPLDSFCSPACPPLTSEDEVEIFRNVRDAAAQVIAAKGATNWAIGLAVARILEAILRDEQAILTVSSLITDYQGINDVCLSVPTVVSATGVDALLPLPLSPSELEALVRSADLLKDACRQLSL